MYEGPGLSTFAYFSYRPQTNGRCERGNGVIEKFLALVTNSQQNDWDMYLGDIAFGINTSIHEITKQSPHYLLYGYQPMSGFDRQTGVIDSGRDDKLWQKFRGEAIERTKNS